MDAKLEKICERVADSRTVLIKKMTWEAQPNLVAILCGFIYASKDKDVDLDRYLECKKLLKSEVSAFSEFRGIAETMVITKMALSNNPREYLSGAMGVYKKLRSIHKLTASPFMVLAAINIYEAGGLERADENIEMLENLYKKMNKKHPLLISDNDRGFLSMLATSGLDSEKILENTEICYKALSKLSVLNKDGVHALSQILALFDKDNERKTEKVFAMRDALKAVKCPVSKQYGLPGLGALAMVNKNVDEIAQDVAEAEQFFKGKKGFKWYNAGGIEFRRIYAQLAVALRYLPEENSSLGTNIISTMTVALIDEIIMLIILLEVEAMSAARSNSSAS